MATESQDVEALWKNHNREKQERETRKEAFFVREDRMTLEINKFVLFRVLSLPVRVWSSFVKNDSNDFRVIQFPEVESVEYNENILIRIVKKVLEKKYLGKGADGKPLYEYLHQKNHPELFNMVYNNGKAEIGKYGPDGWVKNGYQPQASVFIQGINRMPFKVVIENKDGSTEVKEYGIDWCTTNKKTLLLTRNSKSRDCPVTIYTELMDKLIPGYGSFFNYDLAIKKFDGKPWYQVEKAANLTEGLETQALKPFIKDGPTPREVLETLEGYDLNDMAKPTPNSVIYKELKGKIKQVDDAFGTTFLAELFASLSADDKEVSSPAHASTPAPTASPAAVPPPAKDVPAAAPAAAPAPTRAVRTPVTPAPTAAPAGLDMAAVSAIAKNVKKLAPGEAAKFIKGVENGKIVWNDQFKNTVPCPTCQNEEPVEIDKFCIFCDTEFT